MDNLKSMIGIAWECMDSLRNYAAWLMRGALIMLPALLIVFSVPAHAEENVLRLKVFLGYFMDKYVEEFEKEIEEKYGRKVKLNITLAESPDAFYDAVRSKSIDVITTSHNSIKDKRLDYITKKLILPLDLKNIPNYANLIPDLKKADYYTSDGKIYAIPIAHGPYGLAYNTKIFKQAPQSWKIFWDPKYKNRYAIGANEYFYNVNITALAMGYPRESTGSYNTLNNSEFKEQLRQLAANAANLWIGWDRPDDLIGLSFAAVWGDSLPKLKKRGETWKIAKPIEGTMWWTDNYVITWTLADKPFLKKVAEEWINKVLSPDFQVDSIVRDVSLHPVVTNIADKLTDDEKEIIDNKFFTDKRILQHTYSQRDRHGLKLLWDNAINESKNQ